jgi:hypothetical protein
MQSITTHAGALRSRIARSRLGRLCRALHARGEEGMAIAEYAIGILVVAGIGFVVFALIKSGTFSSLISNLVEFLFGKILGLWTLG